MAFLWIPVLILLISMACAALSGAPWVPTWKRDIERAKRLLDLRPGEKFVELGCGDGRVTCEIARLTTPLIPSLKRRGERVTETIVSPPFQGGVRGGWVAVGVELSLVQYLAAQLRRVLTRSWNVRFVLANAFHYDLRSADAVYVFLMPETYQKIRPKLEAELKPGARVLTYVWPIEGWTPETIDEQEDAPRLFLYRR